MDIQHKLILGLFLVAFASFFAGFSLGETQATEHCIQMANAMTAQTCSTDSECEGGE